MKIAIVGAGISGLTCAYLLHKQHDITVFESAQEIGGHTATKDVEHGGQRFAIDTGFIVYNDWTYPNFIRLLDELGVETQPTEMSFSVTCEQTRLEYSGNNLNTLFAQRRNLLNPSYWGMLKDIVRFNREAVADLESGLVNMDASLGAYLDGRGYGQMFAQKYLIPMGSAIWSASVKTMMEFPLVFFIRFFKNHGLLSINNRPQWRVVKGGSRNYLEPLSRGFADRIRRQCPVVSIRREEQGVWLQPSEGEAEYFDQVILACHSDQALSLLKDPSVAEQDILGAMGYQSNDVVLHTDASLLPQRPLAWACWNYRIPSSVTDTEDQQAVLTYNMNMLQGLQADQTFCVTLNQTEAIDPASILGRYQYDHPVFTRESVAACERWADINGVNRTWYCGAYWANGFHEDGCSSGIRVARALGAEW